MTRKGPQEPPTGNSTLTSLTWTIAAPHGQYGRPCLGPGRPRTCATAKLRPGSKATWPTQRTVVQAGEQVPGVGGSKPRILQAGEAGHIPRGTIHRDRNPGSNPARTAEAAIPDQGKPRIEPVDQNDGPAPAPGLEAGAGCNN
jgi:hypothetical protein